MIVVLTQALLTNGLKTILFTADRIQRGYFLDGESDTSSTTFFNPNYEIIVTNFPNIQLEISTSLQNVSARCDNGISVLMFIVFYEG